MKLQFFYISFFILLLLNVNIKIVQQTVKIIRCSKVLQINRLTLREQYLSTELHIFTLSCNFFEIFLYFIIIKR